MNILWHELRYVLRQLRSAPGTVGLAGASLCIGIGLNTAIFSAVHAVLFQAFPFPDGDRLYAVASYDRRYGSDVAVPYSQYRVLREHLRTFESIAGLQRRTFKVEDREVAGAIVTRDFFRVLGGRVVHGNFLIDETRVTEGNAVVLAEDYWRGAFGSDPSLVGRWVRIDGESYKVVGVLETRFAYPLGTRAWIPVKVAAGADERLDLIARLKRGSSEARAADELKTVGTTLLQTGGGQAHEAELRMRRLRQAVVGKYAAVVVTAQAAVAFVLLAACANVGGLMAARTLARYGELAIRAAVGASRWQIARLLLIESSVLAALGGTSGLLIADRMMLVFAGVIPSRLPMGPLMTMNVSVFLVGVGLTVAAALLAVVPAVLRAIAIAPKSAMNLQAAGGGRQGVLGNLLVGIQVALAGGLLIAAAILVRNVLSLQNIDPGFEPKGAVVVRMTLPKETYGEEAARATIQKIRQEVLALPGIRSAGLVHILPLTGWNPGALVDVEGRPDLDEASRRVDIQRVTAGYFEAMKMPVAQGRSFVEGEELGSTRTAIVNQALARRFGGDLVGRRIRVQSVDRDLGWLSVVGVVADVRQFGLQYPPRPEVYVSDWARSMSLVVRSDANAASLVPMLRRELPRYDASLVGQEVRPLERLLADAFFVRRGMAILMGVLGVLALALASGGVYGLVAHSVARRARELGIRISLGAAPKHIVTAIVREVASPLIVGNVLGIFFGWSLCRGASGLLSAVRLGDTFFFVAVPSLLLVIGAAAAYPSIRVALRIDPLRVLRME